MTAREILRWTILLTVAEGLALAIGGRRLIRLAERLAPSWYRLWLEPLARLSPTLLRASGLATAIVGLRLLALVPPVPRPLANLARIAFEPAQVLWDALVARPAEETYNRLLRQFVPSGARVLDLGCGEGDNLARLLEMDLPFGSYLGLDSSPEVLARARARFDGLPKIDFLRNDLLNEQLPPGEFDLILSAWSLNRIPDPFALIVRALRQLRQGGHALLLFVSPPRSWRGLWAAALARLAGRHLYPPEIYEGLPAFTAEEEFSSGVVSLILLENPAPRPTPVSAPPPEQATES